MDHIGQLLSTSMFVLCFIFLFSLTTSPGRHPPMLHRRHDGPATPFPSHPPSNRSIAGLPTVFRSTHQLGNAFWKRRSSLALRITLLFPVCWRAWIDPTYYSLLSRKKPKLREPNNWAKCSPRQHLARFMCAPSVFQIFSKSRCPFSNLYLPYCPFPFSFCFQQWYGLSCLSKKCF